MRRVAGGDRSAPGRRGRSTVPFGGEGRPLARKPTPASMSKLSAAFEQVAGCGSSTGAAGTRSLVRLFVQLADRCQMSASFPACIPGQAQDARDPGPRRRRPGATSPLETLATHHVGEQITPRRAPAMMSTKNSLPKKASRRSGQPPPTRPRLCALPRSGRGSKGRDSAAGIECDTGRRWSRPLFTSDPIRGRDDGGGEAGTVLPLPRTFGGEGRGRHFCRPRERGGRLLSA